MTFEEFQSELLRILNEQTSSQISIEIKKVLKNNNCTLTGLIFVEKELNISPTIYIEPYFDMYQRGEEIYAICGRILEVYKNCRMKESIDVSFFTDFEKVKSRIVFKVINAKANRDLLKDVPFVSYLDLAIVFCALLDTNGFDQATILIKNEHLKLWNVTEADILSLAKDNTPRLLPMDMRNMLDMADDIIGEEDRDRFDLDRLPPLFVLSNSKKLNGASVMLYEGVFDRISKKLDNDLFVLPSSIHELIIWPHEYSKEEANQLEFMVASVNHTELSKEEVLSNKVYFYSRKDKKLMLA